MFTLNRKRRAINALVQARRDNDAAMEAFLQVFRDDPAGLALELGEFPAAELSEFLLYACELQVLTAIPCRCRSDLSVLLMTACERIPQSVLAKAMAVLSSTDTLGALAAHDALAEQVKAACRNRIQAILDERRRQAEAAQSAVTDSGTQATGSWSQSEEVEDYGSGRYCTGCGGC